MQFSIHVPNVTFKIRKKINESPGFKWHDLTSSELFAGKRVVLFAVPGAFTPTCSSTHLPGFDMMYNEITQYGVDEIYCLSVNDSFTMNAWFNHLEIKNVKAIPDGTGEFTRKMGFLVKKDNLGFGMRSWRYSMIVDNGVVEMMWVEDGMMDDSPIDPFQVSDSFTILEYLKNTSKVS